MYYADFSNMFVTRSKETLPISLRYLIEGASTKLLQQLYLQDNAFGPIGVEQFKDFLRTSQHLTVLDVSNTGLGPEAASTIARALMDNQNTKLLELKISRSRIEEEGALCLAEYFNTYDTLEHIEISQNGIRDEKGGASQLAKSLMKSAKAGNLTHLQINDNFFHEQRSLGALCDLLKEATSLDFIDISSSNIDDEEGGRKILEAMVEFQSGASLC